MALKLKSLFYINIAPNQDATIYSRLISKNGIMLGGEYSYLLKNLQGTYLHRDRKTKTKRWSFKTSHSYQPNKKFKLWSLYQNISDTRYLKDLFNTLDLTLDEFLPSYIKVHYIDTNVTKKSLLRVTYNPDTDKAISFSHLL